MVIILFVGFVLSGDKKSFLYVDNLEEVLIVEAGVYGGEFNIVVSLDVVVEGLLEMVFCLFFVIVKSESLCLVSYDFGECVFLVICSCVVSVNEIE